MKKSESTFRGSGGMELFYQRWTPEAETRALLVIVHGFGEHSGRYPNVVNHLVPRGFAVYGFDHRGHGRSPGQRGHIAHWGEFREDVKAFLELVEEREPGLPVFLMGHSLGGLIVLEFVLHDPGNLKGVIASGPLLVQPEISGPLLLISRLFSRFLPRLSLSTRLDAGRISRDPTVVKAYQEDPLVHSKASARLGTEMGKAVAWTQQYAERIRLPLLLIHGAADGLVRVDGSREFFGKVTFPDKEMREYEGGYHEPHNDINYEEVVEDIRKWLERHL